MDKFMMVRDKNKNYIRLLNRLSNHIANKVNERHDASIARLFKGEEVEQGSCE